MSHVEESASRIPLHTHVLGSGESGERPESSRASYLCLVFFVGSEVSDTSNGVALHLDVGRHHLPDQRSKASQHDYRHLVLG